MIEFRFDPSRVSRVPLYEVQPNDYNPKDKNTAKQKNIKRGLEKKGLLMPIFVRETPHGFDIVDGEQRWTSLRDAGNEEVLIYNLGEISDQEAKELTLWMEEKVPFNKTMQAELVKKMTEDYKDLQLPYMDDEINNMIKMVEFNPDPRDESNDTDNKDFTTLKISMTKDQFAIVTDTIQYVQEDLDCSPGRALELICAEFQSSVTQQSNDPDHE